MNAAAIVLINSVMGYLHHNTGKVSSDTREVFFQFILRGTECKVASKMKVGEML